MNKENGGPAFPTEGVVCSDGILYEGMTLREYFAAKAMQAYLTPEDAPVDFHLIADRAYLMADAMLEAKDK